MSAKLPKRVVIDASVSLKWYLPEYDSQRARKWYEAIKKSRIFAIAPDFLIFECANVLLKKHKITPSDTVSIIDDLKHLGIELVPSGTLRIEAIIDLSNQFGLTIYDAIYLELARLTDTVLVTTDSHLLKIKQLTRRI